MLKPKGYEVGWFAMQGSAQTEGGTLLDELVLDGRPPVIRPEISLRCVLRQHPSLGLLHALSPFRAALDHLPLNTLVT